jgi:hypothetical protein
MSTPEEQGEQLGDEVEPVPTESEGPEAEAHLTAPETDTYGSADVARRLGISERRVRQLVADQRLPGAHDAAGNLRVPKDAVHAERRRRRERKPQSGRGTGRKPPPASPAPAVDAQALAEVVARSVAAVLEGQKEITQRAESLLRDQVIEERARRQKAEANLASAEARLAELEADRTGAVEAAWKTPRPQANAERPAPASKRRRWWQR